jgi:hemerythrin-like domain-containing protein
MPISRQPRSGQRASDGSLGPPGGMGPPPRRHPDGDATHAGRSSQPLAEVATTMRAIEILLNEHRAVLGAVARLEQLARALQSGRPVAVDDLRDVIDFCERFVDGSHVAKEERVLFPILAERGLGRDISVVSALVSQHHTGRAHVRHMRRAADAMAANPRVALDLAASALAYVELVREHLRIEDTYFYSLAQGCLSFDEDATLLGAFEAIDGRLAKDAREKLASRQARFAADTLPTSGA